jgi:hypothetical protein
MLCSLAKKYFFTSQKILIFNLWLSSFWISIHIPATSSHLSPNIPYDKINHN